VDRLSDAQIAWLKSGPVVAPTLLVKSPDGHAQVEYEVLDRDHDGRVQALAKRHGFKGFVLRVMDRITGGVYAAKLAVASDYVDGRLEQ
jgi:hypothetical protein